MTPDPATDPLALSPVPHRIRTHTSVEAMRWDGSQASLHALCAWLNPPDVVSTPEASYLPAALLSRQRKAVVSYTAYGDDTVPEVSVKTGSGTELVQVQRLLPGGFVVRETRTEFWDPDSPRTSLSVVTPEVFAFYYEPASEDHSDEHEKASAAHAQRAAGPGEKRTGDHEEDFAEASRMYAALTPEERHEALHDAARWAEHVREMRVIESARADSLRQGAVAQQADGAQGTPSIWTSGLTPREQAAEIALSLIVRGDHPGDFVDLAERALGFLVPDLKDEDEDEDSPLDGFVLFTVPAGVSAQEGLAAMGRETDDVVAEHLDALLGVLREAGLWTTDEMNRLDNEATKAFYTVPVLSAAVHALRKAYADKTPSSEPS